MAEDTTEFGSGCGSMHQSGWLNRGNSEARYLDCVEKRFIDENGNYVPNPQQATEPLIDLTPDTEPEDPAAGGKG